MDTTTTLNSGVDLTPPPPLPLPSDLDARNELVLTHLPEVRIIAARIARRLPQHVQLDDLIQAGTIGLIDAVGRFDRSRPLGLRQYVRIRVTGAILDSLRELDWASRYMRSRQQKLENVTKELETKLGHAPETEQIAEGMGMDLQTYYEFAATVSDMHQVEEDEDDEDPLPALERLPGDPAQTPDALFTASEQRERVRNAMGYLKAEYRRVLRLYYFEELTMAQIARQMHVTESRISQIHARALEELGHQLKRRPLQ